MTPDQIRQIIATGPAIVYQPIVSVTRRQKIIGYEALSRFPDGASPEDWFVAAWQAGLGIELEHAALVAAISGFPAGHGDLAVNVSPKALLAPEILEVLRTGQPKMMVELSESQVVVDYDAIAAVVKDFRSVGLVLAIDDLGAGFASLKHLLKLHPEYLKIDRVFVHDVPEDPYDTALVSAISDLGHKMGALVIAEGVEHAEQSDALRILGLSLQQGWFLGKPGRLEDL